MAKKGGLEVDSLFLGLTRPALFLGVSQSYVILNGLGNLMWFINTSDFKAFLYMAFIHGIGMSLCYKEPLIIELYMNKMQRCAKCMNKKFHGYTNSYDLF